jgi:hypothetical protein
MNGNIRQLARVSLQNTEILGGLVRKGSLKWMLERAGHP